MTQVSVNPIRRRGKRAISREPEARQGADADVLALPDDLGNGKQLR
jgi:hypothetical protein